MVNNQFKNLKNISSDQKSNVVKKVFNDVYENYDLMNDIMSIGMHRLWKSQVFELINPNSNDKFMDLAGGSGDLSKIIKKRYNNSQCILVDSNKNMIDKAKKKLSHTNVTYVNAKAERLPFENNEFDFILCAFGLRNFFDINAALLQIYRTLKPEGQFICLEFSKVNRKLFRIGFELYCKIIPKLGQFFAKNKTAYDYLVESIKIFPNQVALTKILKKSGFKTVQCYDLMDGIASIHIGKK